MANKVYVLRSQLGLTQVQLAKLLKVRQSTISCYETDVADPSQKVCISLIKLFAKKKVKLRIKDIKF